MFHFRTPVCKHGALLLVRGIRMKGRNRIFSPTSLKEDEIYLKKLEAQYEVVKARLAKEEEEAKRQARADNRRPRPERTPQPAPRPLDNHLSLWGDVVSKEDQVQLAAHGIRSLDELQAAYQEADADLNRPPYPSVERLRPRLRLAHELYKSIPQRLATKRSKPSN